MKEKLEVKWQKGCSLPRKGEIVRDVYGFRYHVLDVEGRNVMLERDIAEFN